MSGERERERGKEMYVFSDQKELLGLVFQRQGVTSL